MTLAKIIFHYNMHYKSIQKNKSAWLKCIHNKKYETKMHEDE